jgi:uncharacterized protein with HEPN domain
VSSREWRLRIEDILEAIGRIERYTSRLTLEAFASDTLVMDAVVRNFAVIGEAARNVPSEVEDRYPQVPWSKMRGMRNVVVHVYFNVDIGIVWETARHDLPPLRSALRAILAEEV